MMNRKLVRPNLAEMKEKFAPARGPQGEPPANEGASTSHSAGQSQSPAAGGAHGSQHRRRQVPPENTSAEAFYYVKQMNNRTPMVVVLDNGDQLRGHIEWYDRNCLKVNREGVPNLLVYKHAIRYMYKQEEEGGAPETPEQG
jgi:RNA chaperone Hfq